MKISKESFFSVGSELKISKEQVERYWSQLEQRGERESTPFAKALFYFGAMIIIAGMTWLMDLGWERFGGGGIFLIATIYALLFTWMGNVLWEKKGLRIPAGLLVTIALCMVPLAVYGLQVYFNFWPDPEGETYATFYRLVNGNWIIMELATIVVGLLLLYFFRFPFLTVPIYVAVWFLTMDIATVLFGVDVTWKQRSWISVIVGGILLAFGFIADRKKRFDYGFWAFLFGTVSFWGGLGGLIVDKNELVFFVYSLINLSMMGAAILLRRNVLMVFGAIGVFLYLAHLAHNIFADSIAFPFALTAIGLGVISLGILYQKNLEWIEKNILMLLPEKLRSFLD
ncbi:MAG: DUF2157 domain-containing protein [Parachlamydiaceae bacterium]|nr:DUF2157 domain-containing protein [Parachlamydiaceae bacterium]